MKKLVISVAAILMAASCAALVFAGCDNNANTGDNGGNNNPPVEQGGDETPDDQPPVEQPEPVVTKGSYNAYFQDTYADETQDPAGVVAGVSTMHTQMYDLQLYSDGTYTMVYSASVAISFVPIFNYGRIVTTYGTYEVTDGDFDEASMTVKLSTPTRVRLAAYANNNNANGAMTIVDSDNWLDGDPDGDGEDGFYYTLFQRAESEYYTTKEDFMNALGRAYTCEITVNEMNPYNKQMTVTVDDSRGQIPINAACPEGLD